MPTKGTSSGKAPRRRRIRPADRAPGDAETATHGTSAAPAPRTRGLAALAGLWAGDTTLDADLAVLYASRAVSAR